MQTRIFPFSRSRIQRTGYRISETKNVPRVFNWLLLFSTIIVAQSGYSVWIPAGKSISWQWKSSSPSCEINFRNDLYSVRTLYPEAIYTYKGERKKKTFGAPGVSDEWIVVGSKAGNNIARAVIFDCDNVSDISILKEK